MTNTGSIFVDAGLLQLDNGVTGSGQITVTDRGTVALGGSMLAAGLDAIVNDGGTIEINGTLNNAGNTLVPARAVRSSTLPLNGGHDCREGRSRIPAAGLQADSNYSNVLNGVSYQGALDLSQFDNAYLHLQNDTTFSGIDGTGPGTILVTGYYDHLIVDGTQTLDNATVELGNASGWVGLSGTL